jgi:hypothetical protein
MDKKFAKFQGLILVLILLAGCSVAVVIGSGRAIVETVVEGKSKLDVETEMQEKDSE